MESKLKLLAVLLGVQLAAALGLGLADRGLSAGVKPGPLLAFDKQTVDRISLAGPEGEQVLLAKTETGWHLPELDFPANGARVDTLLDRLAGLQAATPVGSSADARERFKVSEEKFERKLALASGDDELTTLYLGSSPALRHIHARRDADSAIHKVAMAAHDVPIKRSDWEDKTLLQFDAEQITRIELADLSLTRQPADAKAGEEQAEPSWQASGLGEHESLKADAASKLAKSLADLRIGEVLGREELSEYSLAEPLLDIKVHRQEGQAIRYQLGKSEDGDYTLKVSSRPEYFRLPSFSASSLVDAAKRDTLVKSSEDVAEQQAATASGKAAT